MFVFKSFPFWKVFGCN